MTLPMPVDEHANRVAKARSLMAQANVDALIVTDPVTYGYFTGNRVPAWMKARPANRHLLPGPAPRCLRACITSRFLPGCKTR